MAPGIYKTFRKAIKDNTDKIISIYDTDICTTIIKSLRAFCDIIMNGELSDLELYLKLGERICNGDNVNITFKKIQFSKNSYNLFKKILKMSYLDTEKACYQAMEGFVHNLNTLHSRAGAQVNYVA